ncbi:Uu.00g013710.m01.CDS01 [Anthostomella pinea]|uniref:Uu.00g013710.m01.CDS01 n=1 Tax=Anthostomella pinea TaxID=933095 RepID=A0AAI8VY73_9PEZI|nr:Uu.00g013710.m01.CDS01 [Anthostomella pinea]
MQHAAPSTGTLRPLHKDTALAVGITQWSSAHMDIMDMAHPPPVQREEDGVKRKLHQGTTMCPITAYFENTGAQPWEGVDLVSRAGVGSPIEPVPLDGRALSR